MENPIVATNKPTTTKALASPSAKASGPSRCVAAAAPMTRGSSGSTHGDSVESTPAR